MLLVEYFGDHRVVVVGGESADQGDGVLAGAVRRLRPGEADGGFADQPAFPVQHEPGGAGLLIDGDDHVVQQCVQEFLAVAVRGGWCRPQRGKVGAEAADPNVPSTSGTPPASVTYRSTRPDAATPRL